MSSSSRPSSPAATPVPPVTGGSGPSEPAPAPANRHEVAAALTDATVPAGTNPSPSPPVHSTMPSKDAFSSNHDHEDTPDEFELSAEAESGSHPEREHRRRMLSSSAMSKAEEHKTGPHLEAEEREPDSPDVPSVIDISGPPREGADAEADKDGEDRDGEEEEGEVGLDTELTIHIDGSGSESEAKPRASDATEADAKAHTDAGSTLYGSFAAAGEHVHDHPLSLDVHTPTSPRRMKGDEEMGEYEYDEEDEDEEDDLGLGGRGRGGPESPRGFMLTGGKVGGMQMQEFGNKPSRGRPRIPHSAYYFGPPPPDSAYGTDPVGQIGVHHPREIVRVERDYSGGELPQFAPTYPLELEGRITPTQFLETINAINEILISAHSLGHAFIDNALAYFTLQISRAVKKTHHDKEMDRLKGLIDGLNVEMYNPAGLHIKWPRDAAFLFLEIEYY